MLRRQHRHDKGSASPIVRRIGIRAFEHRRWHPASAWRLNNEREVGVGAGGERWGAGNKRGCPALRTSSLRAGRRVARGDRGEKHSVSEEAMGREQRFLPDELHISLDSKSGGRKAISASETTLVAVEGRSPSSPIQTARDPAVASISPSWSRDVRRNSRRRATRCIARQGSRPCGDASPGNSIG